MANPTTDNTNVYSFGGIPDYSLERTTVPNPTNAYSFSGIPDYSREKSVAPQARDTDTTEYAEIDPRVSDRFEGELQDYIQTNLDRLNTSLATAKQFETRSFFEGFSIGDVDSREAVLAGAGLMDVSKDELVSQFEEKAFAVDYLLNQDENPARRTLANKLFDSGVSIDQILIQVNAAGFAPVYGGIEFAYDIPELARTTAELAEQGEYGKAALIGGISTVGALASLAGATAIGKGALRLARSGRNVRLNRSFTPVVEQARLAEMTVSETARVDAAAVAAQNVDLRNRFISEFEQRTGQTVSKQDADGNLIIDPDLVRLSAKERLADLNQEELINLFGEDRLLQPVLNPEKMDAVVAMAADLREKFPDRFTNDKPLIDSLFEVTTTEELVSSTDFLETITKYGLSVDDYLLSVIGSGSEAGKILNKLSQVSRKARGTTTGADAVDLERKRIQDQHDFWKAVQRVESLRRGGMVSQVRTAARNFTSAAIRMPAESLGNLMDEVIYRASVARNVEGKGIVSASAEGLGALTDRNTWVGAFNSHKYLYSRRDLARDYTEYMLNRPELRKQYDRMFNNLNEIQEAQGKGSGTVLDKVLTPLEDTVDILNTPNRWQEHTVRRAVYWSEMERLLKREWNIDLRDALKDGKMRELLNNAPSVKPARARNFEEIVDESISSALDVTYAKQPDNVFFRELTSIMTRYGLTAVIPFPRFMFSSMELFGQYAGGGFGVAGKRMTNKILGKENVPLYQSSYDRKRIQRNIMGWSLAGAAYAYRSSDDAPADYKMINIDDETKMDTSAQYPMRQFLYIGEAAKRLTNATFDDWFDPVEFISTFSGINTRSSVGSDLLKDIVDIATSNEDLGKGQKTWGSVGKIVGNYLSTYIVPFTQYMDAQRALGLKPTEYKELSGDPVFDSAQAFFSEVKKPFKQRGFATDEEMLPAKQYLFSENGTKERVGLWSNVIFGLSLSERDAEYGEYLTELGLNEWDVGSKSISPTLRNWETQQLRHFLPIIVDAAKARENRLRFDYQSMSDFYKQNVTEQEHVNNRVIPLITSQVANFRSKIQEASPARVDAYTRAVIEYRRIGNAWTKIATDEFLKRYDRNPDPLDTDDLQRLAVIAKALRSSYP